MEAGLFLNPVEGSRIYLSAMIAFRLSSLICVADHVSTEAKV